MGSKEVMMTAPAVAFLYDRAFLSPSFRDLLRQRWHLYAALVATELVLYMPAMAAVSGEVVYAGFGHHDQKPTVYLLNETRVILYYLRLVVWPHPLCFDYMWPMTRRMDALAVPFTVVAMLFAGSVWHFRRRPWLGFLGLAFFFILAPTSSFMPLSEPCAERRMYLPLAVVLIVLTIGSFSLLERATKRFHWSASRKMSILCTAVASVSSCLQAGRLFAMLSISNNETRSGRRNTAPEVISARALARHAFVKEEQRRDCDLPALLQVNRTTVSRSADLTGFLSQEC